MSRKSTDFEEVNGLLEHFTGLRSLVLNADTHKEYLNLYDLEFLMKMKELKELKLIHSDQSKSFETHGIKLSALIGRGDFPKDLKTYTFCFGKQLGAADKHLNILYDAL
jgi:hypothetical protein